MSKRKWDDEGATNESASRMRSDSPAVNANAMDAAAQIAAKIASQYAGRTSAPTPSMPGVYQKDQRELKDPEFVKDIEINDLRNRYMLTKGSSQQQIHTETGATVSTKGVWYPDKSKATSDAPPLYLHITAESKAALDNGIKKVEALIAQDLGPLTIQGQREAQPRERRRWPEEKLVIGLESLRNFNVRAKVVGPAGLFVKHIQQETGTKVQIKGIGSGFLDPETGREADEPMHINVAGPDEGQVARAKDLAEDLINTVRDEWQKAKAVMDQSQGGYGGYNNYQAPAAYGATAAYPGYQQPPLPGSSAPPPPSDGAPPPPPSDGPAPPGGGQAQQTPEQIAYWQQIQSNPAYKAYYEQYYAAYYAQQQGAQPAAYQQQQQQPAQSGGAYSAMPPPPGL